MYVCLKNVFGSDDLDKILLQEYASLDVDHQELYRLVAALESMGARVHRQLVLRITHIDAGSLLSLLVAVEGIIDEYVVGDEREGIYRWSTRHPVIADIITDYKYADEDELYSLLQNVVSALNPLVFIERKTIADICDRDRGIGRLSDDERQVELYRELIELAPGERVPRHRLIAKLLAMNALERASMAVRSAQEAVGVDPPISNFKVRLDVARAEQTMGIQLEDRKKGDPAEGSKDCAARLKTLFRR